MASSSARAAASPSSTPTPSGKRSRRAKVVWVIGAVLGVLALGLAGLLSRAAVERTASGVHARLLVPTVRGSVAVPLYGGTGDSVRMPGVLDGPVVRRGREGSWAATWFCEDRVERQQGTGDTLRLACAGRTHVFPLASASPPAAVGPMPDTVVVLSDLEGNLGFLNAALQRLGVTDTAQAWRFGRGHLVVLGDAVDRGRDVFGVLWRLHGLAREATAAGGAVRVVLGNHEQYVLRGNHSRAHPDHVYAVKAMGGFEPAFATETVLGAWLRAQPVALKLDSVVLVHGGVSTAVVRSGLSVEALNEGMRRYWTVSPAAVPPSPGLDAVLGLTGVTQYRGYLMAVEGVAPLATEAQLDSVLAHLGASRIVVAHTVVDRVKPLFGGRVYAVNVNDNASAQGVLRFVRGVPEVVPLALSRGLDETPAITQRPLRWTSGEDWASLRATYRTARAFAALPHPY